MKVSDSTLYQVYLIKHAQKQNKGANGSPDSERLKTYKAEWRFQSNFGSGREFESIAEVQKYVDKITKSATWMKLVEDGWSIEQLFAGNKIHVTGKARNTGRGNAGMATQGRITLDTIVGMNEYTVLHELAHCVGHWHHGRSFRQALVKLVSRFMGRATAEFLTDEFKASKLSYGNARKPMSFEKWVESKARMEKMRNGKTKG
jgi:putative metallohydrolase (TIGR04338 family)